MNTFVNTFLITAVLTNLSKFVSALPRFVRGLYRYKKVKDNTIIIIPHPSIDIYIHKGWSCKFQDYVNNFVNARKLQFMPQLKIFVNNESTDVYHYRVVYANMNKNDELRMLEDLEALTDKMTIKEKGRFLIHAIVGTSKATFYSKGLK